MVDNVVTLEVVSARSKGRSEPRFAFLTGAAMSSTTAEHLERLSESPLGPVQSVIDFVSDEIRSAVSGEPSARQVRNTKREVAKLVWSVVGPLLTTTGEAWVESLEFASGGEFLHQLQKLADTRAGKKVTDEGQRALAVARLRPNRTPEEELAEQLNDRVTATIVAVTRHIERHRPRLPSARDVEPSLSRLVATLTAVVVAGALSRTNRFSAEVVRACHDECIAACGNYARLFGLRSLPATDIDLRHEREQAEESVALRRDLAAQRSEDDRFALMGD